MTGYTSKADTSLTNKHEYDDIIALPHHVSSTHPPMPVSDRAAQFSPFAALTGYDEAVKETARLTERRIELDEGVRELLNEKLLILHKCRIERPQVTITCFVPDATKEGGVYRDFTGTVKKVDEYRHIVIMHDGPEIPVEDISGIDGEIFKRFDIELD